MPDNIPFVLYGEIIFAPRYFPETLRPTKSWKLNRESGFCEGEDVTQETSKNRNIHVMGRLVGEAEKESYEQAADIGGPFTMSSVTWSGEVVIKEAELEGPVGIDVESQEFMWQYTMDLVSTAEGDAVADGIIDSGEDPGGTGELQDTGE